MHTVAAEMLSFREAFQGMKQLLNQPVGYTTHLTVAERKQLSETTLALVDFRTAIALGAEDEYAGSWIDSCAGVLKREYMGHASLFLYYFKKNHQKDWNPEPLVNYTMSVFGALRAMERAGAGIARDTTLWKYIERDVSGFTHYLCKALRSAPLAERTNLAFLACNAIDCIRTWNAFDEQAKQITAALKALEGKSDHMTAGLHVFLADLNARWNLGLNVPALPDKLDWKVGAFLAMHQLRNGIRPEGSGNEPAYLWWIVDAWRAKLDGDSKAGFLPFYHETDIDGPVQGVFGTFDGLAQVIVSDPEIDWLLDQDAKSVKKLLAALVAKSAWVSNKAKATLTLEVAKSDAGGEISDFNVELQDEITMAFPIKSGREAVGQKRVNLEAKFLYQFMRPFLHFGLAKVIVVPILLVHPTLNSTEMLTLVRAQLGLPIFVLDTMTFAQMLKRAGIPLG